MQAPRRAVAVLISLQMPPFLLALLPYCSAKYIPSVLATFGKFLGSREKQWHMGNFMSARQEIQAPDSQTCHESRIISWKNDCNDIGSRISCVSPTYSIPRAASYPNCVYLISEHKYLIWWAGIIRLDSKYITMKPFAGIAKGGELRPGT